MLNDVLLDEFDNVLEEDYEEGWFEQDISLLSKQTLNSEDMWEN